MKDKLDHAIELMKSGLITPNDYYQITAGVGDGVVGKPAIFINQAGSIASRAGVSGSNSGGGAGKPIVITNNPGIVIHQFSSSGQFTSSTSNSTSLIGIPNGFKIGDKIKITEQFDDHYDLEGIIINYDPMDNSYLIEFELASQVGIRKTTNWYYGTKDFVHANDFSSPPPVIHKYHCFHEWREDKWFTSKVFKTCKKCGTKFEDM